MKPILTWTGGKRRLLKHLLPLVPEHQVYHEVFAGGAALFFELEPRIAYLNDVDSRLMDFYRILRQDPDPVIEALHFLSQDQSKERFEERRQHLGSPVGRGCSWAALYLYLNKLGFGGLMRFNRDGVYNVAYARPQENLVQRERLLRGAKLLGKAAITTMAFPEYIQELPFHDLEGHFFYMDPPYLKTKAAYGAGWGEDEQKRFRLWCDDLVESGASVLVSNSSDGAWAFVGDGAKDTGWKLKEVGIKYTANGARVKAAKEVLLWR